MDTRTTYYPSFDYLRIILAIIVMLGHDNIITWGLSGNLSVQVFFALSGWLIGGILLKLPNSELPRFYFNRAIRIWVPYYLALGLLVFASLLRDPINLRWFEFIFYKLSFVYNIFGIPQLDQHKLIMPLQGTGNHFWSVNAEEQFYLIAPFFLVLVASKIGRSVLFWSIISIAAWVSDIYASIIFGVLAAVVVHHYGPIHLKNSVRYLLLSIALITIIGILTGLSYAILAPVFSISLVLILAVKGTQDSVGAFLGGMSYPLYLNHWIGVFVGNVLFSPFDMRESAIRKIVSIIVNLCIAAGLYWWVDYRLVSLRGKLFSRQRGVVVIVITYSLTVIGLLGGLFFSTIKLS